MTHSDIDIDKMRIQLTNRRRDILQLRQSANRSWQRLQEPEIEEGEMGAKYSMAQGLEQLDERSRNEIEQIDRALTRIADGRYGSCEDCGQPIAARRLEAIPWTPCCKRCAEKRDESVPAEPVPEAVTGKTAAHETAEELTDAEIVAAVQDAMQRDGRVETEELQIFSRSGVVHLEGVLPAEASRRRLHELIENVLDFKEVEDRLKIDRTLWENRKRSRETPTDPEAEAGETRMQGESSETDTFASKAEGKPLTPPDTLKPDKNR